MDDRLWAGIPSRYVTSQLGQLSLASLRGRLIEYQLRLGCSDVVHRPESTFSYTSEMCCVARLAMSDSSAKSSRVDDQPHVSETTDNTPTPAPALPSSAIVAYRGVRGLKHRNDRHQRSAARPLGTPAVGDRPSSSEQPRRPVRGTSSRRSVSADRHQVASASTPRTPFETLCQEEVTEGLECRFRRLFPNSSIRGGSVTEWLACWTQAQKGLGSNRSRNAVG